MKSIYVLLAGFTIMLGGSSNLGAATVSPESCSTGTPPVGLLFSFNADALGGSSLFPRATGGGRLICRANNASGVNFTSLMITTPLPAGSTLDAFTCNGDLFNVCSVGLNPAGNTLIFNYSLRISIDGAAKAGIASGTEFAINLGTGGFAPNQTFLVAANGATVPEPASAILILAGAAALLARRKAKQNATYRISGCNL